MNKKCINTFKFGLLITLLSAPLSKVATANDDFFNDVVVAPVAKPSALAEGFTGWFKQTVAYGFQSPDAPASRTKKGLNGVATSVQLQLDRALSPSISYRIGFRAVHDFVYAINDDINPSDDELHELESRIELKDIYIDSKITDGLYFRLGNQLIALGESENLVISDLVSARDLRTIGQADLEDIRQSVPAAKLSYFHGSMTYEFVSTYKAGHHWFAPERNEFDPFIRLRTDEITLNTIDPDNQWEFLFRLNKSFNSGDINLVIADVNDNDLSINAIDATTNGYQLEYSQDRFQALALSGSYATGLWVWKAELASHLNKALMPSESQFLMQRAGWQENNQMLSMLGFDYSGFGNAVITAEIDYVRTFGNTEMLAQDKNQLGLNARWYWQDPNALITLQADYSLLLGNNGHVFRLTSDYELTQKINVGAMLVSYDAEQADKTLYDYRNNDMAQVYFKYNF